MGMDGLSQSLRLDGRAAFVACEAGSIGRGRRVAGRPSSEQPDTSTSAKPLQRRRTDAAREVTGLA